jgi:ribosome assembly protein 1
VNSASIDDTQTPEDAEETKEEAEHLIGFARIYSGTLSVGDEVYVLGPKFTPANPHAPPEPQKVKVTSLYLMMGRSLEVLTSVPAGCVFGIGGLAGHVLKSGTLCSQLDGSVNLAGITMGSQPIVRVALEPENPYDLDKMIKGLKMLVESDPCAEYEQLQSGEHVILTAGELHLERCLKDLKERFAKCEIQAGEPMVPYRESIVAAPEMNPPKDPNLPRGTVIGTTSSKQISLRLRVRPLPAEVTEFLGKNAAAIKRFYAERRAEEERQQREADRPIENTANEQDGIEEAQPLETGHALTLSEFKKQLQEAFNKAKGQKETWKGVIDKIAAFGPRRVGPNILVDATSEGLFTKA